MNKDPYCIRSGEFRKLCHTTRDTLRYYEEQGVLIPKHDPENGYTYYRHAQMGSFYLIKAFQALGSSLQEIKEKMLGGNAKDFQKHFFETKTELLNQREELENRIAAMERAENLYDLIKDLPWDTPVKGSIQFPVRLLKTPIQTKSAYSFKDISEDIRQHIHAYELKDYEVFPMGVTMDIDGFLQGNYRYKAIVSLGTIKQTSTPSTQSIHKNFRHL